MHKRTWAYAGVALVFSLVLGAARESRAAGQYGNPLFAYTHLLPSPLTMPAGRLALGTDVAYGVFDSLQIGTGLLRDVYQSYNANAKLNLLDFPDLAVGAYVSYETYNYRNFDPSNPDLNVTSWRPGLVVGYEIASHLAAFVGGNLNYSRQTLRTSDVVTSGFYRGAEAEYDLSWAYNPKKKSLGNVLTAGVSYDFTYKLAGFGLSHYWRGFHLGVHYYPNADRNRILPILAGGAVVDF